MKKLKHFIKTIIKEATLEDKKLRVFDFDDTLVKTDAKVYVFHKDGSTSELTPGEYAVYEPQEDDSFNYDEFQEVKNPEEIKWVANILRSVYGKYGPAGAVILTARDNYIPIKKFLNDIGMAGIYVEALGSSEPQEKANFIKNKIELEGYTFVEFFDDSEKNARAVESMAKKMNMSVSVKEKMGNIFHLILAK